MFPSNCSTDRKRTSLPVRSLFPNDIPHHTKEACIYCMSHVHTVRRFSAEHLRQSGSTLTFHDLHICPQSIAFHSEQRISLENITFRGQQSLINIYTHRGCDKLCFIPTFMMKLCRSLKQIKWLISSVLTCTMASI